MKKVGDQVLYLPTASDHEVGGTVKSAPWPAIVVSVAPDGERVNLKVFADADRNIHRTNVEEGREAGNYLPSKPAAKGKGSSDESAAE